MHKTPLSFVFACAALLASGSAFATDFNPQPDPPGKKGVVAAAPAQPAFNPQPDPPGRHGVTACPQAAPRDGHSGLASGERKSGGQQFGSSAGGTEACGFEQPK